MELLIAIQVDVSAVGFTGVITSTGNRTHNAVIHLYPVQFRISPHRCNAILGIENWVQKGLFP